MVKKLGTRIAATSGQGISRLSYQQGRAMSGGTPPIRTSRVALPSSGRDYGKASKIGASPSIVADYGNTLDPSDLGDVTAMGKGKPLKGWKQNLNPSKLKVP